MVLAPNVRLYPPVKVTGQSFVGVKRVTQPNQSMSLREIVRRFIRRESLPIANQGIFEERFGDLEKISKSDIVEQLERAEELKSQIKSFNKREKDKADKLAVAAAAAAVSAAASSSSAPASHTPTSTPTPAAPRSPG